MTYGNTTRYLPTSPPYYLPYIIDASQTNRLLLGTNHLYETTSRGNSWIPIATPGVAGFNPSGAPIDAIAAAFGDANTIYVTAGGHIFCHAKPRQDVESN